MPKTDPKRRGAPRPAPVSRSRPRELARAHPDDFIAALLASDPEERARHVRLMRVFVILSGALLASLLMNAYQETRPPRLAGVASMPSGVNKPINTMPIPINTEAEVRRWVTNAVVQSYTFDFALWNSQLGENRQNFTPDGWAGFHKAVEDSGILKAVISSKFKVSAVPKGPTVMSTLPPVDGRRSWQFEVPLVVTYEGPSQKPSQQLLVTVIVVPQPAWQQERGLGIASMKVDGGLGGG
jgi:hypothetical protein